MKSQIDNRLYHITRLDFSITFQLQPSMRNHNPPYTIAIQNQLQGFYLTLTLVKYVFASFAQTLPYLTKAITHDTDTHPCSMQNLHTHIMYISAKLTT